MGLGDDMMFLGEAEKIHKETGKKIYPVDGNSRSPMMENVEFLTWWQSDESEPYVKVNARQNPSEEVDYNIPYYVNQKIYDGYGDKFEWNEEYKPVPFKLRFSAEEEHQADVWEKQMPVPFSECIVVNPDVKNSFFKGNKDWGFHKWEGLTDRLYNMGYRILRFKPPGKGYDEPFLQNALNITDVPLRVALCCKSRVKMGVTFDGLLSHFWAGAQVPCIRIVGDFMSTKTLHYDNNISIGLDENPTGALYPSRHCKEANQKISVDMVFDKCIEMLNNINR